MQNCNCNSVTELFPILMFAKIKFPEHISKSVGWLVVFSVTALTEKKRKKEKIDERKMSKQPRGRSGGAMVLDKLPVLGCPTNLDYSRARAYCACRRCEWGLFGHFFLASIISLFFLPFSGRWPDID